jgi:uncharacterized membrane protein
VEKILVCFLLGVTMPVIAQYAFDFKPFERKWLVFVIGMDTALILAGHL